MKLHLIQNKVLISRNEFHGNVDGVPIEVARLQNGWDVVIRLKANGVVVHDVPPTDGQKADFDSIVASLQDAEFRKQSEANELARKKVMETLFRS